MARIMAYVSNRSDSGNLQFRMKTPASVLPVLRGRIITIPFPNTFSVDPLTVHAKVGAHIKFSFGTSDRALAREREAIARTYLTRIFNAASAGAKSLTKRDLVALSGIVYKLFLDLYGEEPGTADQWIAFKAFNRAAEQGRIVSAPAARVDTIDAHADAVEAFGEDITAGINSLSRTVQTEGLESRFGRLADHVLDLQGIIVDGPTKLRLLAEVANASTQAAATLKRFANSDYTPDPLADRFPAVGSAGRSVDELFEIWKQEAPRSASTLSSWSGVVKSLKGHLKDKANNIRRVTDDDIQNWVDALRARNLSPKTISDGHLACSKALFKLAKRRKLVDADPTAEIRVVVRMRAGERKLAYSNDEVARLLTLARTQTSPDRRWLLPLAASSGARIGELAQLWGSRVREEDGVFHMLLSPAEDGGSIKTEASERTVPIHPALIAEGFLDFARSRGTGPLFYRKSSGKTDRKHASKGVTNRLSTWIRSEGYTDPRKAPAHALRHWWKSAAMRAGVSDSIADRIQGHTTAGEGSTYRHFDLPTLSRAVSMIAMPTFKEGVPEPADALQKEVQKAA